MSIPTLACMVVIIGMCACWNEICMKKKFNMMTPREKKYFLSVTKYIILYFMLYIVYNLLKKLAIQAKQILFLKEHDVISTELSSFKMKSDVTNHLAIQSINQSINYIQSIFISVSNLYLRLCNVLRMRKCHVSENRQWN